MDKPTEWTYGGQLNWSSADSLRLAPVGLACRCIIEALKERIFFEDSYNYFDSNYVNFFTEDYNPFESSYRAGHAIDLMIASFLDNYNGILKKGKIKYGYYNWKDFPYGDLTGKSVDDSDLEYIFTNPHWVLSDLLEFCKISEIKTAQKIEPLSAEWAFQCYKIINAHKFIGAASTSFAPISSDYPGTRTYVSSGNPLENNPYSLNNALQWVMDRATPEASPVRLSPRFQWYLYGICIYEDENNALEAWGPGFIGNGAQLDYITNVTYNDFYSNNSVIDFLKQMTAVRGYVYQDVYNRPDGAPDYDILGTGVNFRELSSMSISLINAGESDEYAHILKGPIDLSISPPTGLPITELSTITCPIPYGSGTMTPGYYFEGGTQVLNFAQRYTMTPNLKFIAP